MERKRSIWKDENFTKFFSANALSNLGNWFDFIAVLILFRYTWNAEPMLIALIPVMYAIPSILFGQVAGVFADRKDKLRILIYSDWIRAALTVLLIFATSPFVALFVLLLRNSVGVVGLPAQQGLLRNIVDEENIMKAVTVNGSLLQLVKVVGPLIGGSVSGIFTPDISIGMNAVSFIISGIIYSRIRLRHNLKQEGSRPETTPFLRSWKEGWAIVFKSRVLLASILYGMIITLTIQMIDAQFVTLFSELFPDKPEMTGWTISAIGAGSLLVILVLTKVEDINSYGWFFGIGSLMVGVMVCGLGFLGKQSPLILALSLAFIGGIGTGITLVAVNYLIQKEPPREAIGRVSGIVDSALSILFIITGPILGGILIQQLGVMMVFRGIGVVLFFTGTLGIIFQKVIWRRSLALDNHRPLKEGVN